MYGTEEGLEAVHLVSQVHWRLNEAGLVLVNSQLQATPLQCFHKPELVSLALI
jgi:hypothetical protein